MQARNQVLEVAAQIAKHKKESEADHQAIDKRLAEIKLKISQSTKPFERLKFEAAKSHIYAELNMMHKKHDQIKEIDYMALKLAEENLKNASNNTKFEPIETIPSSIPLARMAAALPALQDKSSSGNLDNTVALTAGASALAILAIGALAYRHIRSVKISVDAAANTAVRVASSIHSIFKQEKDATTVRMDVNAQYKRFK